jgi:hypothetical protein
MKFSLPLLALLAAASPAVSARGLVSNPDLAGPEAYSPLGPVAASTDNQRSSGAVPEAIAAAADDSFVTGGYLVRRARCPALSRTDTSLLQVEFESNDNVKSATFGKRDVSPHAAFRELLRRAPRGGIKYDHRRDFTDPRIFVGMSLRLDNPDDVAALQSAQGVRAVYPLRRYRPAAFEASTAADSFVSASTGGTSPTRNDTFAPHVMTGVDKLHALGLFGKGITVGVLDTGIDYTHPALNGGRAAGTRCFGDAECQIVGGYDLVGDAYTGADDSVPVPDSDPFADCEGSGHGTHVMGTIIANDKTLGFTGVVPEAKGKMFRVFGCGERTSTTDDVLIAGMSRAFTDGVDIISISIGGPQGWAQAPTSLVASRISSYGVPVVISAGNSGSSGAFFGSSPGTTSAGINVAAVQNTELTGYEAKVNNVPGFTQLTVLTSQPFKLDNPTLPLYALTTTPVANDGCSPLPDSTPDLSDKVVLVFRGTCTFVTKFQNIAAKGGKVVLVGNTPPPAAITYVSAIKGQQAATLLRDDAIKLQQAFAAGQNPTITFEAGAALTVPNTVDGGLLSSFTNFGPSNELDYAPHVAAPGGNILSTWPRALGSYSIISGTSMAAPFISGSVAQIMANAGKGKLSTAQLRSRLQASSSKIPESKASGAPTASVGRTGSGLINTYNAVFGTTTVTPGQLALNDTANFQGAQTITIRNTGKELNKYTLVHEPAGTAITANNSVAGYTYFNIFPVPLGGDAATATFLPPTLVLAPGQSGKVLVTFTAPATNQDTLPLYSGAVIARGEKDGSTVTVPYMGLAASVAARPVLDSSSYFEDYPLPALLSNQNKTFTAADKLEFDLSAPGAQPFVWLRYTYGSPLLDISLVAENSTFQPTITHSASARRSLLDPVDRLVRRRSRHERALHAARAAAAAEVKAGPAAPAPPKDGPSKGAPGKGPTPPSNGPGKGPTPPSNGPGKPPAPPSNSTTPAQPPQQQQGPLFTDAATLGRFVSERWTSRTTEDASLPEVNYRISDRYYDAKTGATQTVPEGTYRILIRAQRALTDAKLAKNYDSFLSQPFTYRKGATGQAA